MKPYILILIIVAPGSWLLGHYLGFWGAMLSMPFGALVGYTIPKAMKDK